MTAGLCCRRRGLGQWLLVEALLEQVAHGAAVKRPQLHGAAGRRLQARVTVLARQREQAQAGAIAHLRVRFVGQLVLDDLPGLRADSLTPVEQALRRPLAVRLVRGRHVFALGAVGAAPLKSQVAGDPPVAVQDFHGMRAQPHIDALPGQGRGYAVEAAVHFDVVVDMFCGQPQNTSCVVLRFLWPSARGTASVAGWRDL